ncbi:MAG: LysR family transcriptional regulator [Tistrella sp.]|nr:LysR family transcriptional regulator [Tistrella sp.]
MIENRLLTSFVAVAEELHFGRAAARLNLAQPALSRQIMMLEDRLRVRLFDRTQRRVELTAAGRAFLERARRILAEIERATDEVKRVASGTAGRLAIGFIHSSTFSVSPSIFRAFRRQFPNIELRLSEMTIAEQLMALENETIDIGILRPPIANDRISSRRLRIEHFVLAVPGDHPLAAREKVWLRELSDEDFVLFSQHNSQLFHSRTVSMCDRAGFLPRIVQHATQIHTVLGLVSASLGISIVPDVARELNMRNTRILEIEDRPDPVSVDVAWRATDRSPSLASFVDLAVGMGQTEIGGRHVEGGRKGEA